MNRERAGQIALGVVFVFVAIAAIVALILAALAYTQGPSSQMQMERTSNVVQTITGGVAQPVLYEIDLSASGLTYADGIFTANRSNRVLLNTILAVNVSGTGGGATTLVPVSVFVQRSGSDIPYGLMQYVPVSTTPGATNTQYIQFSTQFPIKSGETFSVQIVTSTAQQLLGGANKYIAITSV
jgi:hypothetical protein